MRKICGNCFRFIAEHHKTKKPCCTNVGIDYEISADMKGCKHWYSKVKWGKEELKIAERYERKRRHIEKVVMPKGAKREPVPLNWIDSYNHITDEIVPNSEPQCPYCKEYPYSYEQCQFCGQRFTKE